MPRWIWFIACARCTSWSRGSRSKICAEGQVLEILTDYDGALEDIPAWCDKNPQEFMGIDEDDEGEFYKLYVKKLH